MNTKKIWIGIVVVAIVVIGAFSLSQNKHSSDIIIGSSLSLTGPSASIGERVENAMNIAVDEVNQKYPFHLKVVYEDDKGQPTAAVSAVNKLIQVDHTHIIIGLPKSDPLLAVAPITEQNKVILFSPTAGADAISQAGDFVFRNIEIPDAHGKGAADFFKGKNITKVALFTAQASNAKSYSVAFKKNFEANGGVITATSEYSADNTDFRTDIAKAEKSGAQAAYVGVATAKDVGILVRQLRELKWNGPIVVSPAAEAKEFITTAGDSAEGVIVTAAPFDPTSSAAAHFAEAYSKKYGSAADGFAANSYDAVFLIADALKNCGGDKDTACIRDYLYGVKNYEGAGGLTTFDKNGDVVKPIQLKVVKGGQFVKLVD